MSHTILSYSFVGIWEKPLPQIPVLDNKFNKDLFGDPYTTTAGFSPDGFTILKSGSIPPKTVVINPIRLEIVCLGIDEVSQVLNKIGSELKRVLGTDFQFKFSSFGLNTEYEVKLTKGNFEEWMSRRFFTGIQPLDKTSRIVGTQVNFEYQVSKEEKYAVLVQPRVNDTSSVFIQVNDHKSKDVPDLKEFEQLFSESIEKVKNIILKTLEI